MKLYIIQWGFYSGLDGGRELDSIWTNKIWARKYMQDKAKEERATKEKQDLYTDGDYWISLTEVNGDTGAMYGND